IPSTTSHNVTIEIIWTAIPLLIVMAIALPTFKAIYYVDETPEDTDFTLKVVGHQWYWEYIYPDHDSIAFDSYMLTDDQLQPGQPRLLEVDNQIVLPTETNIKILLTAADVIHNFAVPALGIKMDAVPGRINETWVKITKPGVYYGQCSQLCGANHAYMPIKITAMPKAEFDSWVVSAKKQFALAG
ncbi:MAG: cytochrome c oxidase subunit II, partial [Pseudomonadota bacterium]